MIAFSFQSFYENQIDNAFNRDSKGSQKLAIIKLTRNVPQQNCKKKTPSGGLRISDVSAF